MKDKEKQIEEKDKLYILNTAELKFLKKKIVEEASKKMAEKIIAFIETLKVEEDGRHQWRDNHNDCIDRVILKLNQKFINGVEIKE